MFPQLCLRLPAEKRPLPERNVGHSMRAPTRAVALSAAGNRDYFLRLAAAHNITARCRFGGLSLMQAPEAVVGQVGEM